MARTRRAAATAALVLGTLAAALLLPSGAVGTPNSKQRPVVGPGVERALDKRGSARVVIAFRAPARTRTLSSRRSVVRMLREQVLAQAGRGFRPSATWDAVLGVAGRITSSGLERLRGDPHVRRIELDVGGHAADL